METFNIVLMAITVGAMTAGCSTTIKCPEGSLPMQGENIDAACSGKLDVKIKDKDGNIAGECKSKGPRVAMCVRVDWCKDGNSTITPEKISCERPVVVPAPPPVAAPVPPRACRDRSHGIERYARTFEVGRWSNWMGGGYSQASWCNDVISSLRGEHPEGQFEVVASSEQSESRCPPFNCPQYKYYCRVRVNTDPIYVERISSACN